MIILIFFFLQLWTIISSLRINNKKEKMKKREMNIIEADSEVILKFKSIHSLEVYIQIHTWKIMGGSMVCSSTAVARAQQPLFFVAKAEASRQFWNRNAPRRWLRRFSFHWSRNWLIIIRFHNYDFNIMTITCCICNWSSIIAVEALLKQLN